MRHGPSSSTTLLILSAFAPAFGATAAAQQVDRAALVAVVTDAKSGTPIPSAEVVLTQLRRVAVTDSSGRALLNGIPPGTHSVRVRHIGYKAVNADVRIDRDTVTATFALETVAQQLDTVRVADREESLLPRGFVTRRKLGIGRFLSEPQLAAEANREFALVAMTRFPGLRVVSDATGRLRLASLRGNCGSASPTRAEVPRLGGRPNRLGGGGGGEGGASGSSCFSSRPCFVRMFLDDMNLGEYEFDIVRTWDLAGVEYYTGASMPAQYRLSGTACGVLLLWTKR